ncbi:MAG TPA: hypothetical protein VGN86_12910, partial [Pyrinomonadaceae bacterium]|nr:hypothetical protein [Pyrinomonadaceae bacterium]
MYIYDQRLSGPESLLQKQPTSSKSPQPARIVLHRTVARLAFTGRRVRITKVLNTSTGAVSNENFDALTGAVVDLAALRKLEDQAHEKKYGKLHPLLYDELQRRTPFERIPVGLWLNCNEQP